MITQYWKQLHVYTYTVKQLQYNNNINIMPLFFQPWPTSTIKSLVQDQIFNHLLQKIWSPCLLNLDQNFQCGTNFFRRIFEKFGPGLKFSVSELKIMVWGTIIFRTKIPVTGAPAPPYQQSGGASPDRASLRGQGWLRQTNVTFGDWCKDACTDRGNELQWARTLTIDDIV